jgi:hypothetical protein
MSQDTRILTVLIPDPGADNKQIFLMKAPSDLNGGGCRIVAASAINGAATGAGTSFSFGLLKYSGAGTPAVNGTIAPAIGGTAATIWAAGVPQAFVLDDDYTFLDAGEYLVLDYQEDNASAPTNCTVTIHYLLGK